MYILPGEKVASGLDGVLAVEDVYVERPMGYHIRDGGSNLNADVWKDNAQRLKMFEYCPELSLIMDMKLERERCEGDDKQGAIHPTPEEQEAEKKKLEAEEAKKKQELADKKAAAEKKKAAAASAAAAAAAATASSAADAATSASTTSASETETASSETSSSTETTSVVKSVHSNHD